MKGKLKELITRRDFLDKVWKVLGAVALAEVAVMSFSMLRSRSSKRSGSTGNMKSAGSLADIPVGTVMPFRSGRFYLVRLDDGGIMAVSMVCSHLGCTVNWDPEEENFKCPCHSSSFDKWGNVIKSPATRPLNYHRVTVEDGQVMVDLENFLVRKKFDPSVVTYV